MNKLSQTVKTHIERGNLSALYDVEINSSFSWVNIQQKQENGQLLADNSVFLQGHEADQFINEVNKLFNKSLYLTMPECRLYVADIGGYFDLLHQ